MNELVLIEQLKRLNIEIADKFTLHTEMVKQMYVAYATMTPENKKVFILAYADAFGNDEAEEFEKYADFNALSSVPKEQWREHWPCGVAFCGFCHTKDCNCHGMHCPADQCPSKYLTGKLPS